MSNALNATKKQYLHDRSRSMWLQPEERPILGYLALNEISRTLKIIKFLSNLLCFLNLKLLLHQCYIIVQKKSVNCIVIVVLWII